MMFVGGVVLIFDGTFHTIPTVRIGAEVIVPARTHND